MNFLEVKTHLKYLSGRYDLFEAPLGTADIVGTFINQASRKLDRATQHKKSPASQFTFLNVDGFQVPVQDCRAIQEVWVSSTDAKWQIYKKDIQDIMSEYLSTNDEIESSTPSHYAPTITRRIPEGSDISAYSAYMTYLDAATNVGQTFDAIVIVPPTDTKLMVDVRGIFYQAAMTADNHNNYWTINHPLTLIKAALHELEVFNQNLSKAKLWGEAIMADTIDIDKDLVEELISEIDQMEG